MGVLRLQTCRSVVTPQFLRWDRDSRRGNWVYSDPDWDFVAADSFVWRGFLLLSNNQYYCSHPCVCHLTQDCIPNLKFGGRRQSAINFAKNNYLWSFTTVFQSIFAPFWTGSSRQGGAARWHLPASWTTLIGWAAIIVVGADLGSGGRETDPAAA